MDILRRFLKYVSVDTTSDSKKEDTPSTEGQRILAELLVEELQALNIEVYYDVEHCYVYGKLSGNEKLPKIGFVSHLDTSEDALGENIKPNILENYNGGDIVLKNGTVISPKDYPDLINHIGKTLITSDGNTLLGADDKAGIAEVMNMLEYFSKTKEEYGDIYVCFTPDEEIGLGTKHLDLKYFKPDFAYAVDGAGLGEFSYENFNAATATINIEGVLTHCGYAKGIMINAANIATRINVLLPREVPENTENREGFFHLEKLEATVSDAIMKYLIRDFDRINFEKRKQKLQCIIDSINREYGKEIIKLNIEDTYFNMLEIIESKRTLIDNTLLAFENIGITPEVVPIRGGSDGTCISYLGIPCPIIGTGGQNFHSLKEYISLEDMEKASSLLIAIVQQFSKKNNTNIKAKTQKLSG